MIKYTEAEVVFSEIPDEITLAINISNCPHKCKGCHSPYLQTNVGNELTFDEIDKLIKSNEGITCVCFMGEGNDIDSLFLFGVYIKNEYGLKVGIYSGSNDIAIRFWENFDYIKLGKYVEELGPLNNPNTNQRLYKKVGEDVRTFAAVNDVLHLQWLDITDKFWGKIFT